jgi:hypothetical protein
MSVLETLRTWVSRKIQPDTCEFGNHTYTEWTETDAFNNVVIRDRQKVKWRTCEDCGQKQMETDPIGESPFDTNLAEPIRRTSQSKLYDFKNLTVFADSLPHVQNHIKQILNDGTKTYIIHSTEDSLPTVELRADSPEEVLQRYIARYTASEDNSFTETVTVYEIGLEFTFPAVQPKPIDKEVDSVEYIREHKLLQKSELEEYTL